MEEQSDQKTQDVNAETSDEKVKEALAEKPDEITLDEVAASAGTTRQTIIRLFGGKDGLLEAVMDLLRAEAVPRTSMPADDSGRAALEALVAHYESVGDMVVRLLAQEDVMGHPAMNRMGVPLTTSFAKTTEDRQVMEMIYSQNLIGRPYFAPPGVPANRVAALRRALSAALEDKALLADAERSGLEIGAMDGEEMQSLVTRLYAMPSRIIERAKQALIYKPPGR